MNILARFILTLACTFPLVPANAAPATLPVARTPLPSLISPGDYPPSALRNDEQGTVGFRLDIGADGRVRSCSVITSSGSSSLDAATCRIMHSRASFTPATNDKGQSVDGSYQGRIAWRLPPAPVVPPGVTPSGRLYESVRVYTACVIGDAARRSVWAMDVGAIPDAAYASCVEIEPLLLAEMAQASRPGMTPADGMRELKARLRPLLIGQVGTSRRNLAPK